MFKKKTIYIVGIIVFTLILVADLAIYFINPTRGNQGNRPDFNAEDFGGQMPGGSFGGEMPEDGEMPSGGNFTMPEGFDAENFNAEDFGGQMPGGGFGGEMPSGGGFTMPEGLDAENFNAEDFSGQMPGGGRFGGEMPEDGEMPGGGQMSGGGIMGVLRNLFWPVLIVCILGDAVCIFMLIRISKKKDNPPDNGPDEHEEPDDDKLHGRDRSNTILAVIALLLVGTVTITSIPSGNNSGTREAESSVLQEQAVVGDITGIFSGSGTLQSSESVEVEIPVSVSVTSYTVQNGDYVEAGDVIAKVDKNSVLNALYEVQNLISEMDAEIADVQRNTLDNEITSRTDGRIKAVYVKEGDSISKAMYDNGALLLISLGGSMTVEIESDETVSVGEKLIVTLSDDSQIEGKVQQIRNGKITITTTDNGPTPDDTVTVAKEDETILGTGTLKISSSLKVTGYAGTVETLNVEVGDKVSAGDVLLTLEDTEDYARYSQLLLERDELTALESELAQMYQDGSIKAGQSGIVSWLNADIEYTELTAETKTSYTVTNTSALSANMYGSEQDYATTTVQSKVKLLTLQTSSEEAGINPLDEGEIPPDGGETPPSGGTTPPDGGETPPDGGETPPSGGETPPDGGETPPDGGTTPLDGVYAGKVSKVTYGALHIKISGTDMTGSSIAALETMDDTSFMIEKQYAPAINVPVYVYQNGQSVSDSVSNIEAGDKVLIYIVSGAVSQIDYIPGTGQQDSGQGTTPGGTMPGGSGGFPGGSMSGGFPGGSFSGGSFSGGSGSYGSGQGSVAGNEFSEGSGQMPAIGEGFGSQQTETEEEEEATYIVEKSSLCSITPSETMDIEVSVDELDILSLKTGQDVAVTLDALPGQSISGYVKKILPVGTTEDGGSTKYTITVEVPRTEQMLDGMNAAIMIEVSRLEGVLTVPLAAIYEDGTSTYIYTGLNEDREEPVNPVEVVTGASDGTYVEILSGLSEGDVVYYLYADSITYQVNS